MKDLYIIGAGGFGREVAWLVERINDVNYEWNLKGFIDDDIKLCNSTIGKYIVRGDCNHLEKLEEETYVVVAVGNAKIRKKLIGKLDSFSNVKYATLIDPSVLMSKSVFIDDGSIICAGTIITTDITIGKHCIINLDCTIGHDVELEDYVTLYPSVNVSGNTKIDTCTEVGTGTAIIQGINVGSGCIVGANSTIIRNIENDVTVVGSPARVVKK